MLNLSTLVRTAWRWFREFNAANVELWERYLRRQRPWPQEWLHWTQGEDAPELTGSVAPPPSGADRRWADQLRRGQVHGRDPGVSRGENGPRAGADPIYAQLLRPWRRHAE